MTQQTTAVSPKALTPDQAQRRMSMLEGFNFRALTNARLLADQLARLRAVASAAKGPRVSKADMVRIVSTLEELAAKAQADAELDSNCMDYAFHLGPDDLEEFEQLMGTAEVVQTQQ